MSAALGEHLFWTISRASGIAALLLASASVAAGLLMSLRFAKVRSKDLRPVHEMLSLTALGALVVHALALLGDGYLSPSLADVTVPFVSAYEPLWTSVGLIAGWAFLLLGGSYYLRTRIGIDRWRKLHRLTALAWLLSLGHAIGMGTDAGEWWFIASVALVAVPPAALLLARLASARAPVPG